MIPPLTPAATSRPGAPAFFRFRQLGERVVITSQEGSFAVLSRDEFSRFAQGLLEPGSELFRTLSEKNFLRGSFDQGRAVEGVRARKRFLAYGPNLHVLVLTKRCNESCAYCHASRVNPDAAGVDMSPEIAERSVERALQSTSPAITIEFQGGEPLLAFPVLKRAVEHALACNRTAGKQLEFTLVSNLALLDEEKLAFLLSHRVQICTSLDGPAALHDAQRRLPGGSAHAEAIRWIRRINGAYEEAGLDPSVYRVEALLTTTRETLGRAREVVDAYVELGCRALFLRPVDPFGFADKAGAKLGYSPEEFLTFWREAMGYMLELSGQGVQVLERFAAIFLTKILRGQDPNYLDIRSPCGAGIGQLAYDQNGKIYTCDEGRLLAAMGDETFLLGDVRETTYRELMGHPTVRTMLLASDLDAQADCAACAYNPYCGVCPVHSHRTQGTLFARARESTLCKIHKGIQDHLFERLATGSAAELALLERWTTGRVREHHLHLPPPA